VPDVTNAAAGKAETSNDAANAGDRDELANPVWHALIGPQRHLAASRAGVDGGPSWFDPAVTIWHGAAELDAEGWQAMAAAVDPGAVVVVMRAEVSEPAEADWKILGRRHLLQLIAPRVQPDSDSTGVSASHASELIELGSEDVDDMLALTRLTEPGPFERRTIEMGRYLGVRREGRLVAMAGERLSLEGATEISAVCTHPEALGQGLAATLTMAVAKGIQKRGKLAFLHVDQNNERALGLYGHLGFLPHQESHVIAACPKPRDGEAS